MFVFFFILQTYATGKEDRLIDIVAIGTWIFNAVIYAIVICLISYYTLASTFTQDWGLYEAGTLVFVGLVLSLQAKVAFLHHQWAWPHVLIMFISLLMMYIGYIILTVGEYDYYYDAIMAYSTGIFWFFGCFSIPLFAIMIDWVGYYTRLIFYPTQEMLYRELDIEEENIRQVRL
jgi:magnesium-transporting ATPase (P-type)